MYNYEYAKLENGQLQYAPKNYRTPDGKYIANFYRSVKWMLMYGFKKIIDEKPAYIEFEQYLEIEQYLEEEETITIVYKVLSFEE